jgi:hypothetical protein
MGEKSPNLVTLLSVGKKKSKWNKTRTKLFDPLLSVILQNLVTKF